jgi:hypothetical protein
LKNAIKQNTAFSRVDTALFGVKAKRKTRWPAIPISTIRRVAGDSKEQRNPVFVEVAVYLVA